MTPSNLFQTLKRFWGYIIMEMIKFKHYQIFLKKVNFAKKKPTEKHTSPNDSVTLLGL